MPRYDTYFLMKEADVIDYVQTKYPGHFDKDAVLTVKEIGDGNLNYVSAWWKKRPASPSSSSRRARRCVFRRT